VVELEVERNQDDFQAATLGKRAWKGAGVRIGEGEQRLICTRQTLMAAGTRRQTKKFEAVACETWTEGW
jgi:hypothetical protein